VHTKNKWLVFAELTYLLTPCTSFPCDDILLVKIPVVASQKFRLILTFEKYSSRLSLTII
jgi:hypothetical protein